MSCLSPEKKKPCLDQQEMDYKLEVVALFHSSVISIAKSMMKC